MEMAEDPEKPLPVTECMQPVRATIPSFATAESARRRLEQEALRFLVVVAPGTGRLLGAVDAESLAAKACCEGAQCCTVVQHLAPHVDFCFDHESARDVEEDEEDLAARGVVPAARRIPLLVVDNHLKPLGCFSGSAAEDEVPSAVAVLAA